MINEEYNYDDISDYLDNNIDLLISGTPGKDVREKFFYEKWYDNKDVLVLHRINNDQIQYQYIQKKSIVREKIVDLCVGLPRVLKALQISTKNVLVDLSSLDHVSIMALTKQLLTQASPRSFFAAYIRPEYYYHEKETFGYELSQKIQAVSAVPGFARRERSKQTLCSFLGFEGIRLKGILEAIQNTDKLIPIVAFPSGSPQWYNLAIWNNMDILQSETNEIAIHKCLSEGVFEAVNLLERIVSHDEHVVLAPLGTRPHSMACAIYACEHPNSRVVYDFAVENEERAVGISHIKIYHLSSFIKA